MSTLKVDTILKRSGTGTITLGQSGDTLSIPSGATIANSGTATGFAPVGISSSMTSGTGLSIDANGHILKPLQPAFQATPSSNSSAINADTTYTIVADSEIIDRNGDYNTSNGTFTAPVTGLYHLYLSIQIGSYQHNNNYSAVFINTSNRRYTPWLLPGGQFDANGSFYITGSVIADMDANDTATFQFRHDQGSNSLVTVNQEYTFVGGFLLG